MLLAGTGVRGEFEEEGNVICFIDELHTLLVSFADYPSPIYADL